MIGLAESADVYERRGYAPDRSAQGQRRFRRFGMPLAAIPKASLSGTSRACRALIAVRLADPAREWEALRALQEVQFLSRDRLDDEAALERAVGPEAVAAIEDPEVVEAYERDRAEARTAAGSPAEAQGKTFISDGPVRYTAPSVIFRADGRELVAGGFQSLAAYDVLLANLDPSLERRPAPDDVVDAVAAFGHGLYTAEVAEIHAAGPALESDRAAIEDALIAAAAAGRVRRHGDRWSLP
jgi:hypothetical protein